MKSENFLEELANDPKYQAIKREKEAKRAAFEAELTQDEASLVQELQEAGIGVESVWDLVNTQDSYTDAIPILVKHLREDHHVRTKEGLARALAVPEAIGIATQTLIDEFSKINDPNSEYRWALGLAIGRTSTLDTVPQILELVQDSRHGRARSCLPLGLHCLPKSEAEPILRALMDDSDVHERAVETLKIIQQR